MTHLCGVPFWWWILSQEELAGGKQGASAEDGESSAQGQPGAYFGYTRYLYCGKQSEGNRFILNKDL